VTRVTQREPSFARHLPWVHTEIRRLTLRLEGLERAVADLKRALAALALIP
jgi:hypothetical protein